MGRLKCRQGVGAARVAAGAGLLALTWPVARARAQTLLWEKTFPPYAGVTSIAPLGDVNGDGIPDIVSGGGDGSVPSSTCCTGKVHLLSGMDGATLLELTGPAPLGFFGHSVAGPGDVTGDGVADFLVGGGGAAGGLYSGATGSLVYSLFPLGWNVGAPGDTNSDGVPDLLVGDPTFGGAIFSGLAASLLQSLPGGGCQQIGFTVAGIGDVDGDGAGDVVLGAPNMSGCSFPTPGTAHVHSGGTGNLLAIVSGPTGFNSVFGRTVSGLGDVT